MTQLTSGSITIPGLGNGTNFSEMIDQLEQIEMQRALKLNSWKTDWQTRLDAFKQVREAMTTYSTALKAMNSIDKFLTKTVLNSSAGVCSVTATGSADNASYTIQVKQKATNSYASVVLNVANNLTSINTTGTTQTLEFNLGGESKTVTVPPNCTLEGLKNIINNELGSSTGGALGMRATIIDLGNGQQMLQLYSTQTGEGTDISLVSGGDFWNSDPGNMGIMDGAWMVTAGQSALVRINGWPSGDDDLESSWLKLATNTMSHIPGLSITITGEGTTVLDVSLDTEAIKEKIQDFVDATNELRTLLKQLTDYNATASTVDSDYAESQFETQKGGVLMGNYGMQMMMSKMKSYIVSKPEGFDYLEKDPVTGEVISGDLFSSLAQIGIKTDDDQGSPTYGLLVFEDNIKVITGDGVEMITLERALEMDAQGIAQLFAADCEPTVEGYNVGFFSHLPGTTQAGNYTVSYEVDASGNVFNATVNGQACNWDSETNQITVVGDGPAKGLALDIYNNNPTGGTPHTDTIRLKSGFIPGLISMIDNDFLDPDSGAQDTKKGTLSVLISQYQAIIDGINDKIAREDERLIRWRARMEQRFANLEATLSYYSNLESQLESQINALSKNTSSSSSSS